MPMFCTAHAPKSSGCFIPIFPSQRTHLNPEAVPCEPRSFPVVMSPCATTWCANPWTGREAAVEWRRIFGLSPGQRECFPTHHHPWDKEEAETRRWRHPARLRSFILRWIYWIQNLCPNRSYPCPCPMIICFLWICWASKQWKVMCDERWENN